MKLENTENTKDRSDTTHKKMTIFKNYKTQNELQYNT